MWYTYRADGTAIWFVAAGGTFTREGVRVPTIYSGASSQLRTAAHGRVLRLDDGSYVAYLTARLRSPGATEGVYQFTSSDGLTFGSPTLVLEGAPDPVVIRHQGRYVMHANPSQGLFSVDNEVQLVSADGLNWSPPSPVVFVDPYFDHLRWGSYSTGGDIGDIGALVLTSGALRLFTNTRNGIAFYDLAVFR